MSSNWDPDILERDLFLSQYPNTPFEIPYGANPQSLINSHPILLSSETTTHNHNNHHHRTTSYKRINPDGTFTVKYVEPTVTTNQQQSNWDSVSRLDNQRSDDVYYNNYTPNTYQNTNHHEFYNINRYQQQPLPQIYNNDNQYQHYNSQADQFHRDNYIEQRRFERTMEKSAALDAKKRREEKNDITDTLSKLIPDMGPLELDQEGDILKSLITPSNNSNVANSPDNINVLDGDAVIPSLFEDSRQNNDYYRHQRQQLRQPQTILASRDPNQNNTDYDTKLQTRREDDRNANNGWFSNMFGGLFGHKQPPTATKKTEDITPSNFLTPTYNTFGANQQHQPTTSNKKSSFVHQWWYENDDDDDVTTTPSYNEYIQTNATNFTYPASLNHHTLFDSQQQQQQQQQHQQTNITQHQQHNEEPILFGSLLPKTPPKHDPHASNLIDSSIAVEKDYFHQKDADVTYPQEHQTDKPPVDSSFWFQRNQQYPEPPKKDFNLTLSTNKQNIERETVKPMIKPNGQLESRDEVAQRQLYEQYPLPYIAQPPIATPNDQVVQDFNHKQRFDKGQERLHKMMTPSEEELLDRKRFAAQRDTQPRHSEPSNEWKNKGMLNWGHNIDYRDSTQQRPVQLGSFIKPTKNTSDVIHRVDVSPSHPRFGEIVNDLNEKQTTMPGLTREEQLHRAKSMKRTEPTYHAAPK